MTVRNDDARTRRSCVRCYQKWNHPHFRGNQIKTIFKRKLSDFKIISENIFTVFPSDERLGWNWKAVICMIWEKTTEDRRCRRLRVQLCNFSHVDDVSDFCWCRKPKTKKLIFWHWSLGDCVRWDMSIQNASNCMGFGFALGTGHEEWIRKICLIN